MGLDVGGVVIVDGTNQLTVVLADGRPVRVHSRDARAWLDHYPDSHIQCSPHCTKDCPHNPTNQGATR